MQCRWLLVAMLLATTACVPARADQAPDPGKKVSLKLKETPLRQAIEQLCRETRLKCRVDGDVPNVPVTLDIRDASPHSALRTLVRIAASRVPGLTQARDGDLFIVGVRPAEEPEREVLFGEPKDPRLERPVTLDLRHVRLRRALERLLSATGVPYRVGEDVPDLPVTLTLKGVSSSRGLALLIDAARAQCPEVRLAREKGTYYVELGKKPAPISPAVKARLSELKVSFDFAAVPFRVALDQLLAGTSVQYGVDMTVPDVPVTLAGMNVALGDALAQLVEAAKKRLRNLRMEPDGEVLLFRTRSPAAVPRDRKAP